VRLASSSASTRSATSLRRRFTSTSVGGGGDANSHDDRDDPFHFVHITPSPLLLVVYLRGNAGKTAGQDQKQHFASNRRILAVPPQSQNIVILASECQRPGAQVERVVPTRFEAQS
jgi:hypothetical protein